MTAPRRLIPVDCTLTDAAVDRRAEEWRAVKPLLLSSERIGGSLRLRFDKDAEAAVRDLQAKEAFCCSHLELSVEPGDGWVDLLIAGDEDSLAVFARIAD